MNFRPGHRLPWKIAGITSDPAGSARMKCRSIVGPHNPKSVMQADRGRLVHGAASVGRI
ncbi:MAG: hypothetical protein MUP44_04130 [Anaerolineales bacterium]|nr:hypothetical protein [Anaerolineales bacterium]